MQYVLLSEKLIDYLAGKNQARLINVLLAQTRAHYLVPTELEYDSFSFWGALRKESGEDIFIGKLV